MGWFQKSRRDDFKLLKDSFTTLLDDFSNTFGFDPGAIAEERLDEIDAAEYYLFLSGFVLACYASFAKKTDSEALQSYALWNIGGIIREVYKSKSQETSDTLIEKHSDRLFDLLETRQNECIDLLVRDVMKPSGERYAEGLTRRASELIFKGRQLNIIELSTFFMKHISVFSTLFRS